MTRYKCDCNQKDDATEDMAETACDNCALYCEACVKPGGVPPCMKDRNDD